MQDTLDWEDHGRVLADSLVVPPNVSKLLPTLIPELCENTAAYPIKQGIKSSNNINIPQNTSYGSSPFPFLDNFVLTSLASRGGIVGSIRAWSISPDRFNHPWRGILTYHMKDNRWCECIGRAHKGNNIMWNISLKDMSYYQTCHDPDCRRAGFRGHLEPLPKEVQDELSDALLNKALESDDEFEKALLALSIRSDRTETRPNVEAEASHASLPKTCVKCDDADRETSDIDRICLTESSFEEALIEFLNTNPELCP